MQRQDYIYDEEFGKNIENSKSHNTINQDSSEGITLSKEEFEEIKRTNPKMRYLIERLDLQPFNDDRSSLFPDMQDDIPF